MVDLKDRLLAHLSARDPAHDTHHARRVWQLCQVIAEGEGIATGPALLAAACLHDLVTLPKDHPDRAMASVESAKAARIIMKQEGLNDEDIVTAAHAIEAHSFSAGITPLSDEARILQDADRIEALGAIGLARVFSVSGSLGRALWDGDDPFADARELDDRNWALDHFEVKLLRLPETMKTKTGRKIAEDRASYLRDFLATLAKELQTP